MVLQQLLAGRFDKSTIAAFRAATRRDGAGIACHFIGPDDDLAAIAMINRIGLDVGAGADEGACRILHRGIVAMVVTTDQHRAAAVLAAGIDSGAAGETDTVAEYRDIAAFSFAGRGRDAARIENRILACPEHDLAILAKYRAIRIDDAALIDQRTVDADAPAFGNHLTEIQRPVLRCADHHMHVRVR